jgi:methyltransferase (TIGR00027 family)
MSETTCQDLSGVAETLLITLYIRAMESQRPDALIKDERAEALVRQMDQDFLQSKLAKIEDHSAIPSFMQVAIILRSREFDRFAQDFLAHHPEAVVVHIGCGLDTRFERVDNGRVEWYDLDLPDVIELRRKLVGGEGARHHFLAGSVLDGAWLDTVSAHDQRPFLFLAEGVFMYFEEAQVKSLVLTLRDHFPGAELVFDAFSPFFSWANNLRITLTKVGARSYWALKHGQDLERWSGPSTSLRAGGIRLLDERFPFQYPEPRMRRALQMRLLPFLAKAIGVLHYQLQGGRPCLRHLSKL